MAAFVATDWQISSSDVKVQREMPYRRTALMRVTVSDATYPSNGIPIPPASRFGLRVVRDLVPMTNVVRGGTVSTDPPGMGMVVNYDNTNRTIRLFSLSTTSSAPQAFTELATTAAPGQLNIYVQVNGH